MLLASSLGKLVHPFFVAFAWALATFYSWIPNYAVAIALLTLAVMVIVFPITRRGTRSMMRMQLLAPELKKLQTRYKAPAGATTAERQELRASLNEEMMALYKENGVSPTGGCLPMFLQFPVFWILYSTIRGLTHVTVTKGVNHVVSQYCTLVQHVQTCASPLYLAKNTRMYQNIVHAPIAHGHAVLRAFHIDLADSVRTTGLSWGSKIPFIAMILVAIALQYIQMKQLSGRNPAAAQANPQMQQMQKVFPIIFGVIYIAIPAGVNVYFIVSSLFRIGQQEFMYRHDKQIQESLAKLRERAKSEPKAQAKARLATAGDQPKGFRARLAALSPAAQLSPADPLPPKPVARRPSSGARQSGAGGRSRAGNGAGPPAAPPAAPKSQPRAQGKKARRPR